MLTLFFKPDHWALAESHWQFETLDQGIRVETRKETGSDIRAFRVQLSVEAPVTAVLAMLDDPSRYPEWIQGCTESRLIEQKNFRQRLIYQVNDMPWPVTDRDLVLDVRVEEKIHGHFMLHLTNQPDAYPVRDKIRVNRASGYYLVRPNHQGGTHITWEQHTEPGGELPGWLVNQLLVDIPLQSMKNLREQLTRSKGLYQQAELLRDHAGEVLGWSADWKRLRHGDNEEFGRYR